MPPGQRDREPVHRDAVVAGGDVAPPRSPCGPVVAVNTSTSWPAQHQLAGEVAHLALDATQPRRVAVGEHGDLHEAPACHARGWATMSPTIVAFHAHPDDEALLTAGTMARAAAAGSPRGAGARDRRWGGPGGRRAAATTAVSASGGWRRRGGPPRRSGWPGSSGSATPTAAAGAEPEPDVPGGHPVLPRAARGGRRAARRRAAHRAGRPAALLRRQRRLRAPRPRARARGRRARRRDRRHARGCSRPRCRATRSCGPFARSAASTASPPSSTRRRSSVPSRPAPRSPTG